MKKHFFYLIVLLFTFIGYSQKNTTSIDYPQEQLIHPDCANVEDKNACLKNIIQIKLQEILNEQIKYAFITKDTISTLVTFRVNTNGSIQDSTHKSRITIRGLKKKEKKESEKSFERTSKEKMNTFLRSLPKFKVLNKKREIYNAKHLFRFYFQVTKEKNIELIQSKKYTYEYKGHFIEHAPVFPGCEKFKYNKNSRKCFSKKIQTHVATNMIYPKEARKRGMQGKVNIMFKINKKGKISNIKTKGGHPILQKEAIRIIKKLPRIIPGKQNGKPVIVPFVIPIVFKLPSLSD